MVSLDFEALLQSKKYDQSKDLSMSFDLNILSLTNRGYYEEEGKQILRKITIEGLVHLRSC